MHEVGRDAPSTQFIKDFSAEWLDLDQVDFTQPDRKLYRQYDPIVRMAMLDETHQFLEDMVVEDRPVKNLVAADYTYLNSRLCRYYKIFPGVEQGMQRVNLSADSHRGGLLTQGAILKVTANGSTTSPVVRGAWVAERLLGLKIPPPPAGVSAIEPDIRGATTIREQLAKHRDDESCASWIHLVLLLNHLIQQDYGEVTTWRLKKARLNLDLRSIQRVSCPMGSIFQMSMN